MTDRDRSVRLSVTLLLIVLALGALVLVSMTTPVAAHAYLSETDPGNGEQVDSLPEEVTLYFSGDGVVNADITVEGPDGEVVSDEPEIDPDDTQVVDVPIDETAAVEGMYTVDWEVLADDGHTTSGSFFFAVGDEPLDRDAVLEAYEDDEADESVPPLEAGAKSVLVVGVVGLLGVPAVALFAVGPAFARAGSSRQETVNRRLSVLIAVAAFCTLVGALALGIGRAAGTGALSIGTLVEFTETPLGQAWLLQSVLAVSLAGLAGVGLKRLVSRRGLYWGTFLGGLLVTLSVAWTSHSATAIDRLNGTIIDFVHLFGAGLWVGGLAVLALAVVPAIRTASPADGAALLSRTVRRFSVLALVGVTLVLTTGFILASWHVPTADGLFETDYGLVLVAKLALATVALGLGGLNRFVLLSRLEPSVPSRPADTSRPVSTDGGTESADRERSIGQFVRSVRLEFALLVAVLVLSGVLTSAPTAAVAGEGDELTESTIEYEYDDVLLEVTVFPVAEDEADDALTLTADEPIVFEAAFVEDGELVESEQSVRLLLSDEDGSDQEVELEEIDDGGYATVQPLSSEGTWELRLTGAPGGTYVSEWIDATVVPAADDAHDHGDHGDESDGSDDSDDSDDDLVVHDHGHDHGDHDHGNHTTSIDYSDERPSFFQTLLRFVAVLTVVVGGLAVTLESLWLRANWDD
ncbi:copper resistance CopC/CopD family protein [Natrarchaeobaculum sulfurireducens]|uniref:Copper resistance protein CopC n=1 Tax=Natrarchaeobaculum sulfurireducens TaxID=2044521 RepID=A0A346PCA4_9EURY|nr:CopD family protein [Natrarchaeobaculum sulfurireducens]AXR77149.1 hypothetical protein AArc1_0807 [Natrarchaeobaculum sulfurireducens]